eukprot:scaffold11206_cov117-Isochrysis_galbana.AAC.6
MPEPVPKAMYGRRMPGEIGTVGTAARCCGSMSAEAAAAVSPASAAKAWWGVMRARAAAAHERHLHVNMKKI